MNIKAKMTCASVLGTPGCEQVELVAVVCGSSENSTFAKYTPSASVKMQITNPDAVGAFEPGKAYYVDFTPAD